MAADRSAARRWWLAPAVTYAAVVAVFVAWSPASRSQFPLDDAWIHRVYARSLAWAHGLAYNDGAQEAGCTSPLWAMISAPAQWLEPEFGTPAVVCAVKLLGVALGALSVAAVYRLGKQLSRAAWPAALAASLFACDPVLVFSALSGMEVILVVCLWLWLVASIVDRRWRLAAVLLGVLPVARPEAVLLAGLCVVALAIQHRRQNLERITGWTVTWCVLPTALWVAFCALTTGHPLPTTYYVKTSSELGLHALAGLGVFVQHGWARSIALPVIGTGALAAWCAWNRGPARLILLLLAGPLIYVLAVLTTRSYLPLGYYWTRWTDPGVLGWIAACSLGIALGAHALVNDARLAPRVRRAAIATLALAVLAALPRLVHSIAERAERLGSDGRVIERMNVEPGRWIAAHTPATAVVGVNDAGALRYFGERRTIDLIGLNAAEIAFHRVPVAAIEQRVDWFAAYPLLLQWHPAFGSFARLRWFSIPREEYTICDCPGPTRMMIARRAEGGIFAAEQRRAMIAVLRGQPDGTLGWIVAPERDPGAVARAEELRGVLLAAGWRAPPVQRTAVRPRGGLLLVTADDQPPFSATTLRAALDAAGLEVELATGYRARRERTRGSRAPALELDPDQRFVLAVGSE